MTVQSEALGELRRDEETHRAEESLKHFTGLKLKFHLLGYECCAMHLYKSLKTGVTTPECIIQYNFRLKTNLAGETFTKTHDVKITFKMLMF